MILAMSTIMNTYARLPIEFSRGEGSWLYDTDGKAYLDALAGIAVCNLGHCHPKITQAISEQAATLVHTSNIYHIGRQQELADKLCKNSGMENVFFSNSGAEANEAAIKLARLYGNKNGIDKPSIIVMENSFHGRTLATLSATGSRKVHAGFEPLVSGFVRAPYNNIAAIESIAATSNNIVAILVEPVQGEGGVIIPTAGYLKQLREICDKNNWLLMVDEIQTGIGRTGSFFAFQQEGILPDVVSSAKALGNGMPIGACLTAKKAANLFQPGNHGSTFGGNPLACHTASTVIDVLLENDLCALAKKTGEQLVTNFSMQLAAIAGVKEVRGKGMMIGIELDNDCPELVSKALAAGLVINVTAGNIIRLLPPLNLSNDDASTLVEKLSAVICEHLADANS
ncbi:MAG: acetylornithine/N-succinyldiaminopimelate aminotransferase [Pseudomonadales bacterium]